MTTAAKKTEPKKAAPKSEPKGEDKAKDDDAPKRKSYTPEEKIAKLEADLAEARVKAAEKRTKAIESKREDKAKLQAKIDKLRLEMAGLDGELDEMLKAAGEPVSDDEAEVGDDPAIAAMDEAEAAALTRSDSDSD